MGSALAKEGAGEVGWGWGIWKAGWQAEATGGREGQGMPAHVSAGSEPAQVESAPSPAWSWPPTLCLQRQ